MIMESVFLEHCCVPTTQLLCLCTWYGQQTFVQLLESINSCDYSKARERACTTICLACFVSSRTEEERWPLSEELLHLRCKTNNTCEASGKTRASYKVLTAGATEFTNAAGECAEDDGEGVD